MVSVMISVKRVRTGNGQDQFVSAPSVYIKQQELISVRSESEANYNKAKILVSVLFIST